ncbi:MAG: hypothetical protein ACOCXE_04460 [Spirochaetota bacterium]
MGAPIEEAEGRIMAAPIHTEVPLIRARDLEQLRPADSAELQIAGRLLHFSGVGTTTLAATLTARIHARGRPAAWIATGTEIVYPPDLAANGVDLDALVFVFTADARQAARAAEHLLRPGIFPLLVIDLEETAQIPDGAQGRLLRHARRTGAAVVFLTHDEKPLQGSVISLRGRVSLVSVRELGRYRMDIRIIRDKQGTTTPPSQEVYYAPPGMR